MKGLGLRVEGLGLRGLYDCHVILAGPRSRIVRLALSKSCYPLQSIGEFCKIFIQSVYPQDRSFVNSPACLPSQLSRINPYTVLKKRKQRKHPMQGLYIPRISGICLMLRSQGVLNNGARKLRRGLLKTEPFWGMGEHVCRCYLGPMAQAHTPTFSR